MNDAGPITQQKIRIVKRIEEAGRKLGIPEEQKLVTCKIMEIAALERLTDRVEALIALQQKHGFNWKKFLEKLFGYAHSELKKEE